MDRELLKYTQMTRDVAQYATTTTRTATAGAAAATAGDGGSLCGSASLPQLGASGATTASFGSSGGAPPARPLLFHDTAVGHDGPAAGLDLASGERRTAKSARPAVKPMSAKKGGKISLSQLSKAAAV